MIQINTNQLFTNRTPKNKLQKIFLSPLLRILIAISFLLPVIFLNNIFSLLVLDELSGPSLIILQTIKSIIFIILLIISYKLYTKYIEARSALEFNLKNWITEFGMGLLIGGGMVVLITTVLFFTGCYQIDQLNSPIILFERVFRYGQGAFLEELIFTVILFKLLEEQLGTIISYIIVSLFFGASHFINDNATIFTSLSISIIQISLIAPFILTRRIWMSWAVHFSWNFFQAGIFGMNNSGMDQGGFITPIISGPDWLTGGLFGIETSWLSLIINLAVGISILIIAIKNKQIVKPIYKRV